MSDIPLFDFIKIFFEKPEQYEKLKPYEKAKFFFMSQRFFSIAYPEAAHAFNHIRIPQAEVLDYWHRNLRKIYTRTPDWIYTKTKDKKKIDKVKMPSEEAVSRYLSCHMLSMRELFDAIAIFGEEQALEPIRKIDRLEKAK